MTNKKIFSSNFKLGILGGGQLGKMLLQDCIRYDILQRLWIQIKKLLAVEFVMSL